MKLQDSKSLQMGQNAIKSLFPILFFVLIFSRSVTGQNIESATNQLMVDIILQDTIVSENKLRSIHSKIEKGLLTVEDSVKYVHTIKERNLLLYKYQENIKAAEILREDLAENGVVTSELSPDIVQKAIKQFPSNREYVFDFQWGEVKLTGVLDKWVMYHKFSSPVCIGDNSYLIFHYHHISLRNHSIEFLIFSLDDVEGYQIKKKIGLVYS